MTALNFPDNPTNGQTFTSGNLTWTYSSADGTWKGQLSAISEISGGVAGAVPYQSGTSDTSFTAAGTTGQVFLSGGTGSPTWSNTLGSVTSVNGSTVPSSDTLVGRATTDTLTNKTLTAPAINNAVLGGASRESVYTTATGFAGYSFEVTTNGAVQYITANSTANGTVNFRSTSSASLDSLMSVGQSLTAVLLVTNGSTAYYPNAWNIDGTAVTPKWQGGTAPSSGNANAIDVYSVTIIKTASATFTVLASQVKFA
jgi:hypothetical protein